MGTNEAQPVNVVTVGDLRRAITAAHSKEYDPFSAMIVLEGELCRIGAGGDSLTARQRAELADLVKKLPDPRRQRLVAAAQRGIRRLYATGSWPPPPLPPPPMNRTRPNDDRIDPGASRVGAVVTKIIRWWTAGTIAVRAALSAIWSSVLTWRDINGRSKSAR